MSSELKHHNSSIDEWIIFVLKNLNHLFILDSKDIQTNPSIQMSKHVWNLAAMDMHKKMDFKNHFGTKNFLENFLKLFFEKQTTEIERTGQVLYCLRLIHCKWMSYIFSKVQSATIRRLLPTPNTPQRKPENNSNIGLLQDKYNSYL